MSSAGTLLTDLETRPGGGGNDDDLVRQIMADVHAPQQQHMMPQAPSMGLPPPQVQSYKVQQPNASSIYQQSADPNIPTAHMIGNSIPNQADFAQMMMSQGSPFTPQMYPIQMPQPMPMPQVQQPQQGNGWQGKLFDELRQPLLIAIIVFVLSLPAVNVLFSQYAPSLLRSGGDFNNIGLLVRAGIAGVVFWLFQRVIAPLMIN